MLESGGMLEGELSEINLIERFVEFWRRQFTGAIRFENDAIIKIIYFKAGDVLSASTNDRADSIDEILTRAGKVTREHVRQALSRRKENESLGDALLNLGFITRKELTWARRVQVVGVIRSVIGWESGSFTVVADYLPKRDEGTLFSLPQLLVEVIVTDQDRGRVERALGGGSAVYWKTPDFNEEFRRLGLNEDADAIVAAIDGHRSAAEVAAASGHDAFNVYKLIDALATLGLLTRLPEPRVEPQFSLDDDFATAGVADAADLWAEPSRPEEPPAPDSALGDVHPAEQPSLDLHFEPIEEEAAPVGSAEVTPDLEPEVHTPEASEETPVEAEEAWASPPSDALALPIPARIETPSEPSEEWGFDEAQVETARRATTTAPTLSTPPPRRNRRRPLGAITAVIALLVVAGAAYFAYSGFREGAERPTIAEAGTATVPAAEPAAVATLDTPETPQAGVEDGLAVAPVAAAPETTPATTPAVPSEARTQADLLARRYAAAPEGNFTVQIQILCDPGNVLAARRGSEQVWFVPQTIGDRSCYRVFWGRYTTPEEAQRAMGGIPAALRDRSAAVKPVPAPPVP